MFTSPETKIQHHQRTQCFCVSHSRFDSWSHVFFRLHKLCICWTNERPPLRELLGELWVAGYGLFHPHHCSDHMSWQLGAIDVVLAGKDLSGFLERFLYTHTTRSREPQNVNTPPGLAYVTTHQCFVVCWCLSVYLGVCRSACVVWLVDNHKTGPCCLYYLSNLSAPLCSCDMLKHIYPCLRWRFLFSESVIESHHYTAEGNGFGCELKLFGYQAAPEVCLLGASGQLLQLPASGAARIEYFLLQDV